jgi:hypothetical protein
MRSEPISHDMPEDEAELVVWLERLVVDERQGALVAEVVGFTGLLHARFRSTVD